jgi:hypothetical protein
VLILSHDDINEVLIYAELHEGLELMQGVRHHVRDNFHIPLQFEIIGMKDRVRLPLFSHIAQVPKHGKICSEYLKWLNVQEVHTFPHLPRSKHYED